MSESDAPKTSFLKWSSTKQVWQTPSLDKRISAFVTFGDRNNANKILFRPIKSRDGKTYPPVPRSYQPNPPKPLSLRRFPATQHNCSPSPKAIICTSKLTGGCRFLDRFSSKQKKFATINRSFLSSIIWKKYFRRERKRAM